MFISDESAQEYLAGAILLTFPGIGVSLGIWGFLWEALMLLAVLLYGYRKGLLKAALFLLAGYTAALLIFGMTALGQMGFVPLAGLMGIFGWQKRWPVRVAFFWSAVMAGVLGAVPTASFVMQGFDPKLIADLINATVTQYQDAGLLTVMQQQGITEAQLRLLLQQGIEFYVMVSPGIAALISIAEYGLVFYIMKRWFSKENVRIPFSRWRLPWYAVWGAVLGIACYLLGDQFSWSIFRGFGINLMVVYGALALVLGTAVYLFLLKSPRIPKLLKWMLIISSFIYFFFTVVSIIMFGLFDLVFNFRHLPEES